jgi:WD40 repeat protein
MLPSRPSHVVGSVAPCDSKTNNRLNINNAPFSMPLDIPGKVRDGKCLACKPSPSLQSTEEGKKPSASMDSYVETIKLDCPSTTRSSVKISQHQLKTEYQSPHQLKTEYQSPQQADVSPFVPALKGASPVFHSVNETKAFNEQQCDSSKQDVKQEQKQSAQSSVVKSPPRRSIRGSEKSDEQSTTPFHNNTHRASTEGTQLNLHRIMKRNNELSMAMKNSIIHAAVLARKKERLSNDKFLGADGKIYPDLRGNFGKYANMKQCAVCKQRVQGAYFCRLKHLHLEVPDFDSSVNSAECLKALFRMSVEELEGSQGSWMLGREKGRKRKIQAVATEDVDATNWSMDLLNDDIFYQIASFLPTLPSIISFCQTSKRAVRLLNNSSHSEKLFRGIFLRQFGEKGTTGCFESDLSWRERWSMVCGLRRGLAMQPESSRAFVRPANQNNQVRNTVGLLNFQDERDALYYDNPDLTPDDRAYSNGYFGMERLRLPPPPNALDNWQPPVVVRGDFNGLRIFHSLNEVISEASDAEDSRFVALGDNEDGGQILALLHCAISSISFQSNEAKPCCFIGYASGGVAAITAALIENGSRYAFAISDMANSHSSEVTALAFVNFGSRGEYESVLFSACCGGKVYFYPNAMNSSNGYSLEESVLAFSNYDDCPIFSMSSTVVQVQADEEVFSVLCTGDRDGNIRLWLKPNDSTKCQKFRHLSMCKSCTQRGSTGYHLVTRTMFIHNNLLITGTNAGDVRIWQLECKGNKSRANGKGKLRLKLSLRHELFGGHSGAVELMVNIGDVLLTSGGNDGSVLGWNLTSGLKICKVVCHRGREVPLPFPQLGVWPVVKSSVVDVVINAKDGVLTSLCRDGTLEQWTFGR